MKYVIVGAGPAGIVAAETLRKRDSECEITVIGGEAEAPYSRMAIPYFIAGQVDETGTHLRHGTSHLADLGITIIQAKVDKVLPAENRVILEAKQPANAAPVQEEKVGFFKKLFGGSSPASEVAAEAGGESIAYDKLLLATGSRPSMPPISGLQGTAGVYNCWTLDDARNISSIAKEGSNVVLMGAGFVACIIIEALLKRNVNLTLMLGGSGRMVSRMMDHTAGDMIKRWCEDRGVKMITAGTVSGVGEGPVLERSNGDKEPVDLIVVATGVKPNIELLEGSGIEIDQGILINDYFQTNIENIYAAGDIAQGLDYSTGENAVHAIQPTAVDHARTAATNMSGGKVKYRGSLNMNVLDAAGLITNSFGSWQGVEGGERASALDEENYRYLKLEFKDDYLVGAINVGRTEHVGVLRGLIQGKVPLGKWKERLMEDPHRIMEAYLDCAQR
ncbi:MAG: NAD(P)/FAD-dependent oxidoreductase [Gammaproteobacteria bacterium]|nr:MAG: NAD(P)/FAD-dependent oxidoreductase [Gammaproteobacteria bacterium]RLA22736.1 MAG: NAD(P)/FAD-dependent oxidoreductase [Gammaproteobacteria bacterium]